MTKFMKDELIEEIEGERAFIQRTWLNPIQVSEIERETARKWMKALKRDIDGLKSGKYTFTLQDYHFAIGFENENPKRAEALLECGDYNDLGWVEKIDLFDYFRVVIE